MPFVNTNKVIRIRIFLDTLAIDENGPDDGVDRGSSGRRKRVKQRILFRLSASGSSMVRAGTPIPDNELTITNAILGVEDVTGVDNVKFRVDDKRRAFYAARVLTIFGPTEVGPIEVNRP